MILGVVLAGGQSQRFGSDKALARFEGQSLLARAVDQLSAWCDLVVVAGREEAPAETLPDWPRSGMGPLGGLAAGLRYAADAGYETVLSIPVDSPLLPEDLPALLSPASAYLADQPVIGHWRADAAVAAEDILRGDGRHSMRALADAIGARAVTLAAQLPNVNTPVDLSSLPSRSD